MVETSVFPVVSLEDEYGAPVDVDDLFASIENVKDRKRHENDNESWPVYQSEPDSPADFLFGVFS